jgi:dihydrofolate reductase
MRQLILKMDMTVDGYVAGPHGEMDWFDAGAPDQWKVLFGLLKSVDTILMGRGMYPEYSAYWSSALTKPGVPKNDIKYARIARKLPHMVFSRTLKSVKPDNYSIVSGDLKKKVQALKRGRGKNLLTYGGAGFASSLLDLGLVDELYLFVNPTLLGRGKSLFEDMERRQQLELTNTTKFRSGTVLLRYSKA